MQNRIRFFPLAFSMFCVLFAAQPAFAAVEAARAIAVTPGAFVQRDNVRLPLKLKDPVYKSDTVSTDASGKVQLLFADETTVAVAPNSQVNIVDFSYGGESTPNFAMRVGQGLARVVTGNVVQQNREGFKVSTPHATVGIRGTILTADVRTADKSLFILTELGKGHAVTVDNPATGQHTQMTKPGFTLEAGGTGNTLRPATPAELNAVQSVARHTPQATAQAQGGGQGGASASAAPATPMASALGVAANSGTNTALGTMPTSELDDVSGRGSIARAESLGAQVSLDNRFSEGVPQGGGALDNLGGLNASYTGTLSGTTGPVAAAGDISFDLNLASGILSNGWMNVSVSSGYGHYVGTGGSGSITPGTPDFSLGFGPGSITGGSGNATADINGSLTPGGGSGSINNWEINDDTVLPGSIGGNGGSVSKVPG